MKKTRIYLLSLCTLGLLGLGACKEGEDPMDGGSNVMQVAHLYNLDGSKPTLARAYKVSEAVLTEGEVAPLEHKVGVTLSRPAEEETLFEVKVSSEAAKSYLQETGKEASLLPEAALNLPEEGQLIITKGGVQSDALTFTISPEELELEKTYLLALTLTTEAPRVQLISGSTTLYYSVVRHEETLELTRSFSLTRGYYLSPMSDFPANDGNITLECLVNVAKFRSESDPGDAQISTLMGIEGSTLLRFGDAGLPGNKLQVSGQRLDNPEAFRTGKWYHIAVVYTAPNNYAVYVNGEKTQEGRAKSGARLRANNPWFIGRSYNGNRGIEARLAEVRVWTKARSAEEIRQNMYQVAPESEGLAAYWKMDKLVDGKIKDYSNNANHLEYRAQSNRQREDAPDITNEIEPIEVE